LRQAGYFFADPIGTKEWLVLVSQLNLRQNTSFQTVVEDIYLPTSLFSMIGWSRDDIASFGDGSGKA
jgi:hypothetical protein